MQEATTSAGGGQDDQADLTRRTFTFPPILGFILRRILQSIPVFIGVTFICFAILAAAPGDPVRIMMGQHYDAQIADKLRAEWGLDKPFIVQYGRFALRTLKGDLGRSYLKRLPVAGYLGAKFSNTMLLTFSAMFIAVLLGMCAGVVSAARPRSFADYALTLLAVGGVSIPVFWLGMMLQLAFAQKLHWLPVSDMAYAGDLSALWERCGGSYLKYWWMASGRYLILPSVTLATVPMAVIARMTRSAMLDVLGQDYVRTARAKGLSPTRIVLVHAFRNALIPILTVIGNNFAALLTGAVLTETVFAWPGIGRAMVEAISQYDYPVVMGGVMLMAGVFVVINLLVDLSYGLIDPRVRVA